jgi:aspartate carbamoyltransferase catalytic subunit
MKHIISMRSITKNESLELISLAGKIENDNIKLNISGSVAALLFFEPSTRTAFSFDTAVKRLGGESIMMQEAKTSSVQKGETFADTIRTVSQYADLLVIRSAVEGSAAYASEIVDIPVVNAGDGANQHPTQALLDLYSIMKTQNRLENLTVSIVGDLRYGRTVYSLVHGLMPFKPELHFISPEHLRIRSYVKDELDEVGITYFESEDILGAMSVSDVMYVTRIQRERFSGQYEFEKVKDSYQISRSMIESINIKNNFKLMHPLPRVNEITTDVDDLPCAYYFQQAKNGVYMREAILAKLLGAIK